MSRLGTEPEGLLYNDAPSPGEIRKIMLALGMSSLPFCIIMDEPTNHMDLLSVECVEEVLSTVECAVVLVSHDLRFLDNLVNERWCIESSRDVHTCSLRKYSTSETS